MHAIGLRSIVTVIFSRSLYAQHFSFLFPSYWFWCFFIPWFFHRVLFSHTFLVELLALKSFHLWNFSTCFFSKWLTTRLNVTLLSSLQPSLPLTSIFQPKKTWWHQEHQFWCCHQFVFMYFFQLNPANRFRQRRKSVLKHSCNSK